jgi:DNA-binding protein H-NS
MAQTLAQLEKKIALLEARAEKARRAEVRWVVSRIRAAIRVYGLTAEELFGAPLVQTPETAEKSGGRRSAAKKISKAKRRV